MNIYIGYCECMRAWYVARRPPGQKVDFYLHDDGKWRDSIARWIHFKEEKTWVFAFTGLFPSKESAHNAAIQARDGELIAVGAR